MRACGTCKGEGWRWVVVRDGEVVRHVIEHGCPECADALDLERLRPVPPPRRPLTVVPELPAPVSREQARRNRAELRAAVPVQRRRRRPVVPPTAGGAA